MTTYTKLTSANRRARTSFLHRTLDRYYDSGICSDVKQASRWRRATEFQKMSKPPIEAASASVLVTGVETRFQSYYSISELQLSKESACGKGKDSDVKT
mmetsp:Transcript_30275/g.93677  ORF Transcript_30275/g.93677 Transcript_30275/m.93677 type:complete len:99 (+) Transcript_30275:1021-1317(+)